MRTMMEKPLTAMLQPDGQPLDMAGYERAGGYQALRKALTMQPEAITAEVKRSKLRGRGGGGFSTGRKWEAVPHDAPRPRYLVVNADEMEPGSFKDRLLLEQTPHQMIESVIISAFAIQAEIAYIFVRAEYVRSLSALARALAEAQARGYVGADILGSPSTCTPAAAATSAANPAPFSRRWKAAARCPAPARRARRKADCGANQAWSTTSKPCAACRTSSSAAPIGFSASAAAPMAAPSFSA